MGPKDPLFRPVLRLASEHVVTFVASPGSTSGLWEEVLASESQPKDPQVALGLDTAEPSKANKQPTPKGGHIWVAKQMAKPWVLQSLSHKIPDHSPPFGVLLSFLL